MHFEVFQYFFLIPYHLVYEIRKFLIPYIRVISENRVKTIYNFPKKHVCHNEMRGLRLPQEEVTVHILKRIYSVKKEVQK